MFKRIWQRIKKNHSLLMVLCCLAPIVLIIGFLFLFKGSNYWVWLIILLCPLMHIWMMKGHRGKDSNKHKRIIRHALKDSEQKEKTVKP